MEDAKNVVEQVRGAAAKLRDAHGDECEPEALDDDETFLSAVRLLAGNPVRGCRTGKVDRVLAGDFDFF